MQDGRVRGLAYPTFSFGKAPKVNNSTYNNLAQHRFCRQSVLPNFYESNIWTSNLNSKGIMTFFWERYTCVFLTGVSVPKITSNISCLGNSNFFRTFSFFGGFPNHRCMTEQVAAWVHHLTTRDHNSSWFRRKTGKMGSFLLPLFSRVWMPRGPEKGKEIPLPPSCAALL